MKRLFVVTALVAFLLAVFLMAVPKPQPPGRMTGMPWQIEVSEDGSSKVLGIHLGTSTLGDVTDKYGLAEGISLFVAPDGTMSLESYFGSIRTGPLKGKLVVTLMAEEDQMMAMADHAIAQKATADGNRRLILAEADKAGQTARVVKALTYMPAYSKLDAAFFRSRFGEPESWERINEHAVRWFYPDKGLSLLIDAEGREVLQYAMPKDYIGVDPNAASKTEVTQ